MQKKSCFKSFQTARRWWKSWKPSSLKSFRISRSNGDSKTTLVSGGFLKPGGKVQKSRAAYRVGHKLPVVRMKLAFPNAGVSGC